jgi:hypothetical protein
MKRTHDRDLQLRELMMLLARYHGRRHELWRLVNAMPIVSETSSPDSARA